MDAIFSILPIFLVLFFGLYIYAYFFKNKKDESKSNECKKSESRIKKPSYLFYGILFISILFVIALLIGKFAGGNKNATIEYNKLLKSEEEYKPNKENRMIGECWDKLNSYKNKYYTEECQKYREETGDEEYQKWNEQRKRNNEKLLEVIEKGSRY